MRGVKYFFSFFLMCCLLMGCSETTKKTNPGENYFYQVADDGMGLKRTEYEINNSQGDIVETVDIILKKYDKVKVRDFEIREKQLTIHFSSSYSNVKGIDEVLLRAAIVKTLCQVEGVDYVEFYIEDTPLETDGNQVGVMNELSFLDSIGADGDTQQKYVTLYFSDSTGKSMREVNARLTYDMTVPLAKLLVEQLIAGPEEMEGINVPDLRQTVPEGTVLNSLTIRDNVCYVDFSDEFLILMADVKSELVVYSIVNTLCELPDVNKVQFSIDGEQQQLYGDTKNFNQPFERNLDLVTGGSKG